MTLADEDSNSILADNDNTAVQGNVAMQVAPPDVQILIKFQDSDKISEFQQNFRIFFQISEFLQNFWISTKFQDFDQIQDPTKFQNFDQISKHQDFDQISD